MKATQQAKSKVDMELGKATKQIEGMQTVNDDQSKLIKRLQKRLILVSRVSLYTQNSIISFLICSLNIFTLGQHGAYLPALASHSSVVQTIIIIIIILYCIRRLETTGSVSRVLDVNAASVFNVEVSRVSDSSAYVFIGLKLLHPSPCGPYGPKPLTLPL
jgi:hypothetical protein